MATYLKGTCKLQQKNFWVQEIEEYDCFVASFDLYVLGSYIEFILKAPGFLHVYILFCKIKAVITEKVDMKAICFSENTLHLRVWTEIYFTYGGGGGSYKLLNL